MTGKSEARIFKEQFDVLSVGTDEYAFTIPTIEQTVIAQLPERRRYLDIGAGHGNLTKSLSRHFEHTVIIEPNPVMYDELIQWANAENVSMSGHVSNWTADIQLEPEFDFILMSHVLYYIPYHERRTFIGRAFDLLKPGGRLVIITVADRDSDMGVLYRTFFTPQGNEEVPFATELLGLLDSWGYDTDMIAFTSDIAAPTLPELYDLIDFLLLQRVDFTDPDVIADREQVIQERLIRTQGYAVTSPGGIITLKKG